VGFGGGDGGKRGVQNSYNPPLLVNWRQQHGFIVHEVPIKSWNACS
jgi:hypothetical protein